MLGRAIRVFAAGDWPAGQAIDRLRLPFEDRHRRRLRLATEGGSTVLLDLERATVLREGDGLLLENGCWIAVEAAPEAVVDAYVANAVGIARLAWHLGNRHLPVELLADGGIRFRADPVIEKMVRGLGARITRRYAPFTPEEGAYMHRAHGDAA